MKEQCFVRIQLLCNMRDQINLFLDSIKESTFISLTIEGHYLLSDGASILVID